MASHGITERAQNYSNKHFFGTLFKELPRIGSIAQNLICEWGTMTRWVLLIAAVMRTPPISEFHPFSGSCWRYKHSLVQLLSHLAVVIKMEDGINYQPEPSKVKFALMLAFFFFFSFVSLPRIVLKKSSRH